MRSSRLFDCFSVICMMASMFIVSIASAQEKSPASIAVIDGFRSAKFGMTEDKVMQAIETDFKELSKTVQKVDHPLEKTKAMSLTVPHLFESGGPARIAYVLGYSSRKLIQVNIAWGHPFEKGVSAEGIVSMANLLRNYFAKKGFRKDDLLMNARLKDGSVIVFRGTDPKGHMVLLLLNNPQKSPESEAKKEPAELSLKLSYFSNPNEPDVFKIKDGAF